MRKTSKYPGDTVSQPPPPWNGPIGQRTALTTNAESVAALQRHAARGARHLDARHRAQPFDAVANQPLDGIRREEPRTLQRHPHRQHVGGVESRLDGAERHRRANQQSGPDEQNQRQRHFHDHEDRARLVLAEAGAGSAGAFLERRAEIRARRLNRGNETEDDAGERAIPASVKSDDPPVHSHQRAAFADAGQIGGVDRQQRANARHAEREAEDAADQRQHDAFGEQLPHDAAAPGAQGRAHRNLAPASGRAHEQQVRDVRARDQQHEADGAPRTSSVDRTVAHQDVAHAVDAESLVRSERVRDSSSGTPARTAAASISPDRG